MNTVPLKLVTIVAEAVLEDSLLQEIKKLGAKGYTLTEARGEGSQGVQASQREGKNIKIETLVSLEVADQILDCLYKNYFPDYAMVAYVHDVEVAREEKHV